MTVLYKHKNNTDVAVEVLSMFRVPNKDYAYIKIMWWNIGRCHRPYCMRIKQHLTTTVPGRRKKYPLAKWYNDWEIYHDISCLG